VYATKSPDRRFWSVASHLLEVDLDKVWEKGKHPETVRARSLLCFRAVRELGITMTELVVRLGLAQPAVSICVKRGEKLVKENAY